ncbi:hypothetical protein KIN20_028944 [Parelaphostrongylus tenuis]|uniref:Uncharacterized protein n=1 Tax=Parelaphostrongylus tenuis TaxID=148309 RepID=A0AAD5R1X6_PARTN|nr:hypothetical protein KIN20_028944 [Parelaphostrongylus tenuis]
MDEQCEATKKWEKYRYRNKEGKTKRVDREVQAAAQNFMFRIRTAAITTSLPMGGLDFFRTKALRSR